MSTVQALVVAGGGGGGGGTAGGGGAGGLLYDTALPVTVQSYSVTVGAGGAGGAGTLQSGFNGGDSSFSTMTAIGGGGGGKNATVGSVGGSGGGGGWGQIGGVGTSGQGFGGGSGLGPGTYPCGGGGGSSSVGGNASGSVAGNGGNGTANSISGSSVTYAGGGGGGSFSGGTNGTGGTGGGGNGGNFNATGYGSGGGGSSNNSASIAGNGTAGIVIISYETGTITATGGTVTYAGGNTIHTFTTSGTFDVVSINQIILEIDGTDRSGLVDWRSIKREQVLSKEADKLSFLIRKHNGQTYKPTAGNEVVLNVGATKEFGGYVVEIQEDVDARVEYIKCICKDYTHDLDRQLVSKTYEAMTVDAIIADLIGTFATGITDNNVNCPVTLDSVTFNYLPISRCLTRLTELVDGFEWYIDYDKDIHFFETALVTSAFDLTDTSGNYAYNSLSIREDTHQLRNEVIIRGGLLTSSTLRTEYASGDGTKDVFPLATKFANLPTVTISAVNKTVGVENIDGTGFDCYWNYNEKSLKFTTPPAAGTSNIAVTEYPQYPLILQKRNESSITTYGVFQHVIVDKNIRDLETAGLRADVELLRYSNPEKTASFLTYTSGLMTGQTINVQSTIRGVDEDFKIQSIRSYLRTPDTDELTHEIECVTAEDLGINDILARLLITNPSDQIEIQEGEFIERIRQLTESFTVTDSTPTATEVTGPFLYGTAIMGFSTWA